MKKKKKNLPGTAWAPAVLRQLFSGLMCRGLHYSNYCNIKTWNRCNGRPAWWVEMHKILLTVGSWPIAALMKLMFWTSLFCIFCQLCEVKLKSSINIVTLRHHTHDISIWALLISAFWQKDLRNRGKIKSNCLEKPKKDVRLLTSLCVEMRLKAEYYTPIDLLCNLKSCLPLRQNTCSCTTPSLSSLQLNCVLFHPNTSITEEKKYAVLNSKDSGWGLGEDLQDSSRDLALHIHHSEPPTSANYALALTTCSSLIPNKWGLLVTTITTVLSAK